MEPIPKPEHPFPQSIRSEWLNLNGPWEFGETNEDETDRFLSEESYPEKIIVPFCRKSSLSGIHRKEVVKKCVVPKEIQYSRNNAESQGCIYTPTTGIWQTVWLEGVGSSYIENYFVKNELRKKGSSGNEEISKIKKFK